MEEMLKQILGGINDIKLRMDNMEKRVDGIEAELKETRAELKETRAELKEIRAELKETRAELQETKAEVKEMREEVTKNTVTVEYSVNKALKIMGEGYQLNAERLDRIDVEKLKNQVDLAYTMSRIMYEKVNNIIAG